MHNNPDTWRNSLLSVAIPSKIVMEKSTLAKAAITFISPGKQPKELGIGPNFNTHNIEHIIQLRPVVHS